MEQKMPYGVRFSILHRAFRRRMDERVREFGLTGVQFCVLKQLLRLEHAGRGEVNQKDLEAAAHLTHPTMTEIIKLLESKGYICCRVSTSDRRCKAISSTKKSELFLQETDKRDADTFQEFCRGLTTEETDRFLIMLDVMLNNALRLLEDEGCNEKKGSEHI